MIIQFSVLAGTVISLWIPFEIGRFSQKLWAAAGPCAYSKTSDKLSFEASGFDSISNVKHCGARRCGNDHVSTFSISNTSREGFCALSVLRAA